MSALKVSQIKAKLLAMFEPHLDLTDLGISDQEREVKILSRCLAALAIYRATGCTLKEAAGAVWDGADDDGLDAVYFDPSETRVLFVQSKWIQKGNGEPAAKDLGAFTKGVRDAIENNQSEFHPRLHTRLSDIFSRLSSPGTSVHLITISTGSSILASHATSVIKQLVDELNGGDPDEIASSEVIGLAEVYASLANDSQAGSISVEGTILEWSYVSMPYPAYYGMIDGLELKQWWKAHGKRLVAANIRHSLGATDVNNEIKSTATNAPALFWYFNNGITLVADEALKAPAGAASRSAGQFQFKGVSVVNGAQTVSSLAKVDNDTSLGNVRVPIRVIMLKTAPQGFVSDVTRTNNLQNRIELRDFVAQDPEQHRIRLEMSVEGVDYQFVRSDEVISTATACELGEVVIALACSNGDPNLAVQAKTGIGRFFADLSKAPYKTIFNPSTSGAVAFNATITLRKIEEWIEKKKASVTKKSGVPWGTLVHGNRILAAAVFQKLGKDKLSRPIGEFSSNLDPATIATLCDPVYAKMVLKIETSYPGKFLAVLFKNPSMSASVFTAAIA